MRAPSRIFFVIGAPRCGTTAISNALRDHPGICFAVPKEPHYFSRLPKNWSAERLSADYLQIFFRHAGPEHVTYGEGSPSYIYSDEAIDTIERQFPQARYIVMVRNPMEMLPSYHQRLVYLLDETETDLVKAWRLQEARSRGEQIPKRCRNTHMLRYRDICSLADRIDTLIAKVGRERVKLVLFDDFSRVAIEVYRDTLRFLDLPDDGRNHLPKRNRTRVPRMVLLHLLMVQPRSELMRLLLARLRQYGRKSSLIAALLRTIRRRSATVAARPVVPPELWDECVEAFRPSVQRLSQHFGRDLSTWLERVPARAGMAKADLSMPAALAADD